jgi:hypothetical protein
MIIRLAKNNAMRTSKQHNNAASRTFVVAPPGLNLGVYASPTPVYAQLALGLWLSPSVLAKSVVLQL